MLESVKDNVFKICFTAGWENTASTSAFQLLIRSLSYYIVLSIDYN